jgi:hypothetical protein
LVNHKGALPHCINFAAPMPVSMKDLAQAAGLPWHAYDAPDGAQESITLDCSVLSDIHDFDAEDSSPARMVQDWRDLST